MMLMLIYTPTEVGIGFVGYLGGLRHIWVGVLVQGLDHPRYHSPGLACDTIMMAPLLVVKMDCRK